MNFKTKQEYRTEWKADYIAQTAKIRELKHLFKGAQREFSASNQECYGPQWKKLEIIRSELRHSKGEAKQLLSDLVQAKAAAQCSYKALVTRGPHCHFERTSHLK